MRISLKDRARSSIHILKGGGLEKIGMGFVAGPRHLITCAHVVADALDLPPSALRFEDVKDRPVRFACAFRGPQEGPLSARVVDWRAVSSDPDLEEPSDIALLELDARHVLPADVKPVVVLPDLRDGEAVGAFGVSLTSPKGAPITGKINGLVPGRGSFEADSEDTKVERGCSGAALWSRDRDGIVGMIAQKQLRLIGLFVPAEDLLDVYPALARAPADNSVLGVARQSTTTPLRGRLRRLLHDYDRQETFGDFQDHLSMTWKERRSPTVCVFGSVDADLPEKFLDRCQISALAEATELGHEEISDMLEEWDFDVVGWPRTSASPEDDARRLAHRLRGVLAAKDITPESLCRAFNRNGQVKVMLSEIALGDFGSRDRKMLAAWAAFCSGIQGLEHPLIHLVRIKLDRVEPCRLQEDADAWAEGLLDKCLGSRAIPGVARLRALPCLDKSQVDQWLTKSLRRAKVDQDVSKSLRDQARQSVIAQNISRLEVLQYWLDDLNI